MRPQHIIAKEPLTVCRWERGGSWSVPNSSLFTTLLSSACAPRCSLWICPHHKLIQIHRWNLGPHLEHSSCAPGSRPSGFFPKSAKKHALTVISMNYIFCLHRARVKQRSFAMFLVVCFTSFDMDRMTIRCPLPQCRHLDSAGGGGGSWRLGCGGCAPPPLNFQRRRCALSHIHAIVNL